MPRCASSRPRKPSGASSRARSTTDPPRRSPTPSSRSRSSQRLLDRDERLARAELRQLREVLTRELQGVRAYLSQLRPPLLADLGLSGAIREAADQIATALDIPVYVDLDEGVDSLPETVEIVTLRVIQEALQNVRKHAQPRNVRVRMARNKSGWTVEVRDDGKGFGGRARVSGRHHFGLQFMRERAELIGARSDVRSSPDLGTAVRMTIPPMHGNAHPRGGRLMTTETEQSAGEAASQPIASGS